MGNGSKISLPEFWKEKWRESNNSIHSYSGFSSPKVWNAMAADYGKKPSKKLREQEITESVAYLERQGFEFKGSRILDIGCGPGKHSSQFAEKGAEVDCIDAAENMTERLKKEMPENLMERITPITANWRDLSLEEYNYLNKFDLVFANMTPGVSDPDDFLKLIKASSGYVWFQGWAGERENIVQERVYKEILKEAPSRSKGNFMYVYNLAVSLGYLPDTFFSEMDRTSEKDIDKLTALYTTILEQISEIPVKDLKERVYRVLKGLSSNGKVKTRMKGYKGTMVFDVNKKSTGLL